MHQVENLYRRSRIAPNEYSTNSVAIFYLFCSWITLLAMMKGQISARPYGRSKAQKRKKWDPPVTAGLATKPPPPWPFPTQSPGTSSPISTTLKTWARRRSQTRHPPSATSSPVPKRFHRQKPTALEDGRPARQ